jgi:putative intracellular protease/amidase
MNSKRTVLVVASNYGFWGEELQAPWDRIVGAGHEAVIATPQGKKPLPLAISVDPAFVDPIQNCNVNPPHVCERVKELTASDTWAKPLKLSDARMDEFDAIVVAGGLGADLDLANNHHLHELLLESWRSEKPTGAICFGVAALVFTRDPANDHRSIIYGRRIAAHPREWDFKADASYELWGATDDNQGTDLVSPGFIVPLQDIAEDAVGPDGHVEADPTTSREQPSVVCDGPFVTGCSVESSLAFGTAIVDVLAGS